MRAIGGDEMRESSGKDIRPIPNCTIALVDELQLLLSTILIVFIEVCKFKYYKSITNKIGKLWKN